MDIETILSKHFFIINPEAGCKSCCPEIRKIRTKLRCRGLDVEIICPNSAMETEEIVRKITEDANRNKKNTLLYACGGDGTLNNVINGIMNAENHDFVGVTHIPRGSGNDFIKSFKRPELFFSAENMVLGFKRKKDVDLIKVNDRYCINIASAGLDARVCKSFGKFRKSVFQGKAGYTASALINLAKGISKKMQIKIFDLSDNDLVAKYMEKDLTLVCVANGSYYGGGYHVVPEAEIDDGILDVLIIKDVGFLKALKLIKDYQNGEYKKYPDLIEHYQTKKLIVTTDNPEPINLDGEIIETGFLKIEVVPKALKFFYLQF